jgi:hypothetical protein
VKQFLLGVLATVVAGIVLFLAQSYLTDRKNAEKQKLEYAQFTPAFTFSEQKAAEWQKQIPTDSTGLFSGDRLAATAITVENTGQIPIQNETVVIQAKHKDKFSGGVIYALNDVVPGGDEGGAVMNLHDGILTIRYKLINAGEFHRFWVVADSFADLQFIVRDPKLDVTGWDAKIFMKHDPKDWTPLLLFGGVALFLVSFILGAFAVGSNATKIATAYGLDGKKFFTEGQQKLSAQRAAKKNSSET